VAKLQKSKDKKQTKSKCKIKNRKMEPSGKKYDLIDVGSSPSLEKDRGELIQECCEFLKIFSAILKNSE
jgi:hypothetical protein